MGTRFKKSVTCLLRSELGELVGLTRNDIYNFIADGFIDPPDLSFNDVPYYSPEAVKKALEQVKRWKTWLTRTQLNDELGLPRLKIYTLIRNRSIPAPDVVVRNKLFYSPEQAERARKAIAALPDEVKEHKARNEETRKVSRPGSECATLA